MSECGDSGVGNFRPSKAADCPALIAALRTAGADKFDPVGFHYISALANRASIRKAPVKRILEGKLAARLTVFGERFQHAQNDAKARVAQLTKDYPQAADELQRLFLAGDFSEVSRLGNLLDKADHESPLSDLIRHIRQHSPQPIEGDSAKNGEPPAELKAIRHFRNTWSKLSVSKQVAQAIEQAPDNAGPLNSHFLVLRSLAVMRELSPDYLNRFMSYVDTLLCLEQADKLNRPVAKKAGDGEPGKSIKRSRIRPSRTK